MFNVPTPAQRVTRDRINDAWSVVRDILRDDPEWEIVCQHLDRASTHLREAWLFCDGQEARTLEKLAADIAEGEAFEAKILNTPPGGSFTHYGKVWRVGGSDAPGCIKSATSNRAEDIVGRAEDLA